MGGQGSQVPWPRAFGRSEVTKMNIFSISCRKKEQEENE